MIWEGKGQKLPAYSVDLEVNASERILTTRGEINTFRNRKLPNIPIGYRFD